jgi:hypothetical protein
MVIVPGFRSHIFFLNFVDEDDNMVIGNYVSEGKKLYLDVFSQHQPIPYLMSSAIQQTISPENIFMNVKRHREFVILWSLVWIFILTYRFGWPVYGASLVIELAKINFLGNLFLAESLVVYPLLYVMSYLLLTKKYLVNYELWFVIGLIGFMGFTLAPLWPLLAALIIWIYAHTDRKKSFLIISVLIALIFVSLLSLYSGVGDYWRQVVVINYQYYLPLTSELGVGESLLKAFTAPIFVLINGHSTPLLLLLKILSVGFILELFFLIKSKHYVRSCILFAALGLSSLRYIDPSQTLYGAFHMLPWFSLLVLFNFTQIHVRTIRIIIIFCVVVAATMLARVSLWDQRDPATDYYVHYSPHEDVSQAVTILSQDSPQTIWVEPVSYWPYWHTFAKPYSSMIFYYGWMDQVPLLKDSLTTKLQAGLPTIIIIDDQGLGIGSYIQQYQPLSRDGKPTSLYLRQDKFKDISDAAKAKLSYYRFEIN